MIEKKNIFLDIVLTVFTFGIWNFWVQFRQIEAINKIKNDGEYHSFPVVLIFSVLSFGLYFVYHEYCLTRDLHLLNYGVTNKGIEIAVGIFTFIGLWFVVDSYQQSLLNSYVDKLAIT
jgi:hypothetical protein